MCKDAILSHFPLVEVLLTVWKYSKIEKGEQQFSYTLVRDSMKLSSNSTYSCCAERLREGRRAEGVGKWGGEAAPKLGGTVDISPYKICLIMGIMKIAVQSNLIRKNTKNW